jgi:hypothetical protein
MTAIVRYADTPTDGESVANISSNTTYNNPPTSRRLEGDDFTYLVGWMGTMSLTLLVIFSMTGTFLLGFSPMLLFMNQLL